MKKYIVNYIFVCLVILIVTSLLYMVNYDIIEYYDSYNESTEENVATNLSSGFNSYNEKRIQDADDTYIEYWSYVKDQNIGNVDILDGCGSRFSAFMHNIKDKVDQEFKDLDLCKDFTDNDYTTLDLTDSGRNARIKATCIENAVSNNKKGLNQLMSEYKLKTTPLGRCGYLRYNGYE